MKISGVEWFGEIPENWDILRIGQLYENRNNKVNDTDWQPLSVTKNGIVPQLDSAAKTSANDDRKQVLVGDFVINSRSDRKQSCGLSQYNGSVSLINLVIHSKHESGILPEYTAYIMNNYGFAEEFYRWGSGIVADLWSTRWDLMKRIFIPVPPETEQIKISTYLDKICQKIDRLIALQEEMIAELQAYKQSVITEAVTKGLDPDVPMKDSGVEWIGIIPEHWDLKRLKFGVKIRNTRTSDSLLDYIGLENIESYSGRLIHTDSKYEAEQSLLAMKNDTLFGKLRPYLAKVYLVPDDVTCSGEFVIFYNFQYSQAFLRYQLLTTWYIGVVDSSTYGTKMPRASIDFIKNLAFLFPPKDEQDEIVIYLQSMCENIDNITLLKRSKIDALKEYKKSLIYECVTGKRDCDTRGDEKDAEYTGKAV